MTTPTDSAEKVVAELRRRSAIWRKMNASAAPQLEDEAAALIESQRAELAEVRKEHRNIQTALMEETARTIAAEARVTALEAAIKWALGEGDSDFGDNKPENAKPFWWRTELLARAALSRSSTEAGDGA